MGFMSTTEEMAAVDRFVADYSREGSFIRNNWIQRHCILDQENPTQYKDIIINIYRNWDPC